MNSLFTCSWQKNVTPINESAWVNDASSLLNEAGPGKRGKAADPRYARLMGLGSVRELAGTMTPRYFATKVIRQLEADHPGKPIDEISDDDLLQAMNLVSNLSRKLAVRPDIKMTTQKTADVPKAEERVKKGKDAFETLNLNLDPDEELEFDEDLPSGYGVYTGEKDGLKYRVTVKEFDGKPMKVKDLAKDNLASLIVTDPKVKQRSDPAQVEGDIDLPGIPREKPVLDFPAEGEGDFSGPDPEDVYSTAMGEEEAPKRTRKSRATKTEDEKETETDTEEKEPGAEDVSAAEADEPEFTATQAAERKKGYWERLKEKDPELYKKAWAKRMGATEDDDFEPEPEKVEAPENADADTEDEDYEEECEGMDIPMKPTIIIVKKSPQALQREMLEQQRLKKQNKFKHERRNMLGY